MWKKQVIQNNSQYKNDGSVSWDGRSVFYNVLLSIQLAYVEKVSENDYVSATELLKQEYLHIVGYMPLDDEQRKAWGLTPLVDDKEKDTVQEIDYIFNVTIADLMKAQKFNEVKDQHFEIKKQLSIMMTNIGMKLPQSEDPKKTFKRGLYG